MTNVRKRILELTTLSSASLDTTLVGVDNGVTVKIELDTLADAVTSRVNILDRNRLSSLESVTSSFEIKGRNVISSSAQITTFGFISTSVDLTSLNSFTQSQNITNTAFTNGINSRLQTSSFNSYTSSQEVLNTTFATTSSNTFVGNQIISGGIYMGTGSIILPNGTEIYDIGTLGATSGIGLGNNGFGIDFGSNVNDWAIFQNANIIQMLPTNTFGIGITSAGEYFWTFTSDGMQFPDGQIQTTAFTGLPIGSVSGSSQLTSSFDTRYTLSGSVQPLPSNLVSSSAQITTFGFISQSTDISSLNSFTSSQSILNTAFNNGISARLQTSSFNDFSTSVDSRIIAATNEQSLTHLVTTSSFNEYTASLNAGLTKASGIVATDTSVTLGDIQVQFSSTGNNSFKIKTTGSNFIMYVNAHCVFANTSQQGYNSNGTIAVSSTFTYLNSSWDFNSQGDTAYYMVYDYTNGRVFRITGIVGPGYANNFISIERVH